ncbi:hypothetical protein [Bosea sp. AS-1]|uniref:hypothetical protein n=1 Tax=Bosea sp. AS-1 TaxID=2015316 RepID=UPI000B78CAA6|nr:hypothetical protein [Bosea sp. AS-1]
MTITIYNEAGEVVTDPQEQARRLQAEFGPGEVRIFDNTGTLLAERKSGPVLPPPTFMQWLAAKFMRVCA